MNLGKAKIDQATQRILAGSRLSDGALTQATPAQREKDAAKLSEQTGWPWGTRELAHFYSHPHQVGVGHKTWRRDLSKRLFEAAKQSPNCNDELDFETVGCLVDVGVGRLREVVRILSVLYTPPLSTTKESYLPKKASKVFERLNPYWEIGGNLSIDAVDTGEVDSFIPPSIKNALCVGLSIHADKYCPTKNPECGSCELSRFCRKRRLELRASAKVSKPYKCIDLFCGAGGMTEGFANAGFRSISAIDFDEDATRTYRLNHPETTEEFVICGDIGDRKVLEGLVTGVGETSIDVLVGGPPCQGFSNVGIKSSRALMARRKRSGFREEDDDRNYLFEYLIEATAKLSPKTVLMENVPGMDARRGDAASFMENAKSMLEELGYSTTIWKLDAAAFGVPQHRVRKFLVASKAPVPPPMPEPEYLSKVRDLNNFEDLLPTVTLCQAISDLPLVNADEGDEVQVADFSVGDEDPFLRHFVTHRRFPMRNGERLLFNHRARYNNSRDLELFGTLEQGENSLDALRKHGRSDLMRYRKDVFHDKYFRLSDSMPSRTIVSHLSNDGNGYIHPTQNRTLTPRECARLQSFPDRYVFCGSASSQWRQIGNAVPPVLALTLANAIRHHIERFFQNE
jgi:DNA (cytosine-5)-methyltransferase 1